MNQPQQFIPQFQPQIIAVQPFQQVEAPQSYVNSNFLPKSIPRRFRKKIRKNCLTVPYGSGMDAKRFKERLFDFDIAKSQAAKFIFERFGKTRIEELVAMINLAIDVLMDSELSIRALTRDEKRNWPLLVKYVEDHFAVLRPILKKIELTDENGKPVNYEERKGKVFPAV